MRGAIVVALAATVLAGCAGIATYHVEPVYSAELQRMVCCSATITSGKDVSSVAVDVKQTGDDVEIHFTETGVGASAPIAAASGVVSSAITAVGDVVTTAAKFSLVP
ncbi:hypothetical protein [Pararobbsia silviterrae]|uniref:Lipoprotein n=1 Tax=Pararobbsia silviterrae TaxID=1792498 RepID=A0A494X7T6_9BURK|nr:hypothetical protein [Pararobbsia silviterrae]RKP43783.1 hypothetical protein D7S86_28345 [Pararobbsia silviterrae]